MEKILFKETIMTWQSQIPAGWRLRCPYHSGNLLVTEVIGPPGCIVLEAFVGGRDLLCWHGRLRAWDSHTGLRPVVLVRLWSPRKSVGPWQGGIAAVWDASEHSVVLRHYAEGLVLRLTGLPRPTAGALAAGPDEILTRLMARSDPGGDRRHSATHGEAWAGMVVRHAVTRSVRDSATLLDAIAGAMPGDPYFAAPPTRPFLEEVGAEPGRLRIGLRTTAPGGLVATDPECVAAAYDAAELLGTLGHEVVEDTPTALDDESLMTHFTVVLTTGVVHDVRQPGRTGMADTAWIVHRGASARKVCTMSRCQPGIVSLCTPVKPAAASRRWSAAAPSNVFTLRHKCR